MQNLMDFNYSLKKLKQIIADHSVEKCMKPHIVADEVRESQIMLKKAKVLKQKSHNARTKTSMSVENPMPHPHF